MPVHNLDIKLALLITPSDSSTYDHFSTLLRKKSTLEMDLESYVSVVDEMITYSSLTLPDAQTNSFLGQLRKSAADAHKTLRWYDRAQSPHLQPFNSPQIYPNLKEQILIVVRVMGHFTPHLRRSWTWRGKHIYQGGGTFIGNHVHKLLKVNT